MERSIPTKLSKGGKFTGLVIALLLLNITAFADVFTSLSFDKPPGYHQATENVAQGNYGEMIADNTIQFSNSDPDHHERTHYTNTYNCNATVSQLAFSFHCGVAVLMVDLSFKPIGCPQYPMVLNNGPPKLVGY